MLRTSPSIIGVAFAALLAAISLHSPFARADDTAVWQSVKKAGVLRCGAATAPPYVMRDPATGKYNGFFSELCREFGENVLKVKVEFVNTTWDNIVAGLQSEKWDLSLALNDTPARREAISFSKPAIDYTVSFAYNKKNPKFANGVKTLADMDRKDVTVAVMSGTAADKAISAALKQANIVRLPGDDEVRLALLSRRVDMVADPSITNMLLTQAHPDWAASFNPNPPLAHQDVAFGIRKDTPAADVAVLNTFIEQQVKTGQVDKLVKGAIQQMLEAAK
ncbi:polar amino acid transport system substrate-binding protein [Paraburkholderia sp. BL23I1N1]|uniref:substrate-binding periplasmic protein n=1 Tax=unclassified Paraburkholderia TaxID=2615204 RepID=UPI000E71909C|nr:MULTISPECIES: transporter substrate-binding domain-containing protein [unclassified Paraburkholderia]RKE37193.1 polar amino acid transport system substrate-binding protein [Paraburkholderia sp. BL23I1N1]TDY15803.1 polar amino acid transport system substrate-binding protein [Paraburkholderia sp. BL6665CI2N2]